MNRKSQKFSLKFLINLILAFVVFIPVIIFASKLFRLSGDALESFNSLVNTINEMGTSNSSLSSQEFALRMDPETMIVFFNSDQDLIEVGYEIPYAGFAYQYCIEKPSECESENCACLFKKYSTGDSSSITCYGGRGEGPTALQPGIIHTGTNVLCKAINLKPTQAPGGFALFRWGNRLNTYTIEKAGNFFNICSSGSCIEEKITNQINLLQSFKESYDFCIDKDERCICSSFKPSDLDEGSRLELISEEDKIKIKLIGYQSTDAITEYFEFTTQEEEYATIVINEDLCSYNLDNQQSEFEDEIIINNSVDTQYLFSPPTPSQTPSIFFTNKENKTCLLKKTPNNTYYHGNKGVWEIGNETDYAITTCGYQTDDKLKVIFVPVNSEVDLMIFNEQVTRAWTAVKEAFNYDDNCKSPILLEKVQVDQSLTLETDISSIAEYCYLPEYEDYSNELEIHLGSQISFGNYLVIGIDDSLFTVESSQFGQTCDEFIEEMGAFVYDISLSMISADFIEAVISSQLFEDIFVTPVFSQYGCLYS